MILVCFNFKNNYSFLNITLALLQQIRIDYLTFNGMLEESNLLFHNYCLNTFPLF